MQIPALGRNFVEEDGNVVLSFVVVGFCVVVDVVVVVVVVGGVVVVVVVVVVDVVVDFCVVVGVVAVVAVVASAGAGGVEAIPAKGRNNLWKVVRHNIKKRKQTNKKNL